jgi:hypothetical protein
MHKQDKFSTKLDAVQYKALRKQDHTNNRKLTQKTNNAAI